MSTAALIDDGNESLPDPEDDYLDFTFDDTETETLWVEDSSTCKDKGGKDPGVSHYILGTMIVRVVAARDLELVQKGGGLGHILFGGRNDNRSSRTRNGSGSGRGSANPYASVRYCGQSQRTTEVYDTTDPVWPRGETMYLDVSLPVSNMVQDGGPPVGSTGTGEISPAVASARIINHNSSVPTTNTLPPQPILTVAVFHANESSSTNAQKYPQKKGGKQTNGDSDDPFLGMTSVDLTSLLTGKVQSFDEWLPLTGTENNSRGQVRIVCEYEATDPPPRSGDKLKFTTYCNPADLYPVSPGGTYVVKEVEGDYIIFSYTSPEGWPCTFSAHRFMFVCEERYCGAIESYQEELTTITERLSYSPFVSTVKNSMESVPEEGLISVGANAAKEGVSLLGRWLNGGADTAIGDIVYATNWDGRFNPDQSQVGTPPSIDSSENNDQDGEPAADETGGDVNYHDTLPVNAEPLDGMPCCPITGEPMIDPVVSADGHTYERSAIQRWLRTSNKSPLTGGILPHKELVPNYMLVSSLQDSAEAAANENDEI